jgi:predicted DNA binding protein
VLIAEFSIESPILIGALAEAPGSRVIYEEHYRSADDVRLLFWAEGDDVAAFDAGLAADPTIADATRLSETPTLRLYRVTYTERGRAATIVPIWGDLDVVLLSAEATVGGWELRMRVPGRDELRRLRAYCRDRGVGFSLSALYHDVDPSGAMEADLSADQREALQAALDAGYYEIPREASLADVAADLGISSQALSERLRRATGRLVRSSLRP